MTILYAITFLVIHQQDIWQKTFSVPNIVIGLKILNEYGENRCEDERRAWFVKTQTTGYSSVPSHCFCS